MKILKYLSLPILLVTSLHGHAQKNTIPAREERHLMRTLTTEPGIGIHTNFGTDILLTNLVQWNPSKRLSVAAHTSFNINNAFQRNFNYIRTDHNYSINQKIGAGTTFYSRKSAHTLLLMLGVKYTAFKETLENPNFDKVTTSVSALSPDYGMMYSYKRGWKKYYFTYRIYVPLYPWPTKGSDMLYLDGNMDNVALELGLGIKLK